VDVVHDTTCDMSESTHDDDDNDNDTTTINKKLFSKLIYNKCLSLLVCLMSFIDLSFLSFFNPSHTMLNIRFAMRITYTIST
jgi:hypothetical protein